MVFSCTRILHSNDELYATTQVILTDIEGKKPVLKSSCAILLINV